MQGEVIYATYDDDDLRSARAPLGGLLAVCIDEGAPEERDQCGDALDDFQ